jgi:MinD-like ATPase involved in chromosome partitioning or flagellar assembly
VAVLALVSAKGSPGVTTTAAALACAAATQGEDVVLVELDPSGGDVAMLVDAVGEAGLVSLAEELRHGGVVAELVRQHAVEIVPGVPAVLAPPGTVEAAGMIGSLADRWMSTLQEASGTVVVDAGRWDPGSATSRRVVGADVVAVVCRATAPSVEHTRRVVDALRSAVRCPVAVLVVGTRPYAGEDVAAALDLPLAGVLAWDPRGAAAQWAPGRPARSARSWLGRSAAAALQGLTAQVPARLSTTAAAGFSRGSEGS